MKLKPLQQWICDECHEVVDLPMARLELLRPRDGEDQRCYGFRIVHRTEACQLDQGSMFRQGHSVGSMDIEGGLTGPDGLVRLLSILTPGNEDYPRLAYGSRDPIEWSHLVRRLLIPHYEEARQYWTAAERDGFFGGANEYWPYTQETLRTIIDRYSSDESN